MFSKVNLRSALVNEQYPQDTLLNKVQKVFRRETERDKVIMRNLTEGGDKEKIDIDILPDDHKNIFSLTDIRNTAIKYRLRFLDSSYFKSDFPYEAIIKIKEFEKKYGVETKSFKVLAPSGMLNLKDCNKDPLLFVPVSENKYYLIHQWGKDLAWYRRILSFPLQSIYTFFVSVFVPAAIIAWSVPADSLGFEVTDTIVFKLWFTVHCFIGLFFFLIFLGSIGHTSFSEQCWNSKYFNK